MKKHPALSGLLSLLAPGLGQIYKGESHKGACILVAAILIGNLNLIILPLIAMANPGSFQPEPGRALWAYWIPRIGHDVLSLWSIEFWVWAIGDAMFSRGKPDKEAG